MCHKCLDLKKTAMTTAQRKNRLPGYCWPLTVVVWLCVFFAEVKADELVAAQRELAAKYHAKLVELAAAASQHGDERLAQRLQTWLPTPQPAQLALYTRDDIQEAVHSAVAEDDEFAMRFAFLRRAYAGALFDLARKAPADGRAALALAWATETLRENPDHEQALKTLGFELHNGRPATPGEIQNLRAGRLWHDRFGWLPQEHVARYENGERFYNGRWISADADSRLHSDIARGWEIETEHYEVTTNHSLEAGVALAARLERFYDVWSQLFAGFHLTGAELERMFERGVQPRRPRRLHKVVYFATRQEYDAALAKLQPGIAGTLGIYFGDVRTAYFFAGEEQDAGTIFHEATHQLFQEIRPAKSVVALSDNFWIVEGIACYMESLKFADGYALVGGLDAGRVPAARVRLLQDGFYVPFAEMVTYGSQQVQRDPRIRTLYSQFAGQATFLMHDKDGRYRDAVSMYLQEVYRGAGRAATLENTVETSYAELDRQYRQFLQGAVE